MARIQSRSVNAVNLDAESVNSEEEEIQKESITTGYETSDAKAKEVQPYRQKSTATQIILW